ncbi:MAG: hypothetical protein ACR2QF_00005, partial [Geminicoccaceae bacterium]
MNDPNRNASPQHGAAVATGAGAAVNEVDVSTVWVEEVSWIDRVPRSVSMLFVFVVFIAFWELLTRSGLVSAIILPTPFETLMDLILVGNNLIGG